MIRVYSTTNASVSIAGKILAPNGTIDVLDDYLNENPSTVTAIASLIQASVIRVTTPTGIILSASQLIAGYTDPIISFDSKWRLPENPTMYVETTGSDTNSGLVPTLPLLTFNEALRKLSSSGWLGTATIQMGVGTFQQSVPTGSELSTFIQIPLATGGTGPRSMPLIIRGTMVEDVIGTRTASAVTAGVGATFAKFIDSVGGLVPSAYADKWIRVTSGSFIGARYLLNDNTAGDYEISGAIVGALLPVAPFTFVIEDTGTQLQWSGSLASKFVSHRGSDAAWLGIDFSANPTGVGPSMFISNSNSIFGYCKWSSVSSAWSIGPRTPGDVLFGLSGTWNLNLSPAIVSGRLGGCLFSCVSAGSISSAINCRPNFDNCKIDGMNVFGSLILLNSFADGRGTLAGISGGSNAIVSFTRSRVNAYVGASASIGGITFRAAILATQGSFITTTDLDVSNTSGVTADGICVPDAGVFRSNTATLSGGINTGFGLRVRKRSSASVTTPASHTLTGTLGDVEVGAAGMKTWALIDGGAVGDITDLGAAVPELVRVAK